MTTTDSDLRVEYFKGGLYGRVYSVPSAHPELDWTPLGGYPHLGYLIRFGSLHDLSCRRLPLVRGHRRPLASLQRHRGAAADRRRREFRRCRSRATGRGHPRPLAGADALWHLRATRPKTQPIHRPHAGIPPARWDSRFSKQASAGSSPEHLAQCSFRVDGYFGRRMWYKR